MAGISNHRGPRITGGRFHGRRLFVPSSQVTRPARARVRRSVFDILAQTVAGTRWLDLYAGSGSLGLEALSRGAEFVAFVEAGKDGSRSLSRNLEELRVGEDEACMVRRRIPQLFQQPAPGAPFDLVSMDPPFIVSREADSLKALCEGLSAAGRNGWWHSETRLIWEEPGRAPAPVPGGFEEVDRRDYGTSRVRFFRFVGEFAGD